MTKGQRFAIDEFISLYPECGYEELLEKIRDEDDDITVIERLRLCDGNEVVDKIESYVAYVYECFEDAKNEE
jgi:hypothetical protein